MLHFDSLISAEPVFKALSTPMRIKILESIYHNEMSMNDLAQSLSLTNSAVSIHVSKLIEAGLVEIEAKPGKHGTIKLVKPCVDRLIVDLKPKSLDATVYEDNISVGQYVQISASPTCGLATSEHIIGELDSPKVFDYPERFLASVIWMGSGRITYVLPNRLTPGQTLTRLQLSFEISSECPGCNDDFPSDIYFELNGISLGKWISPGDFGKRRRGYLNPEWWASFLNQYGLLKNLIIDETGTYIDGSQKISDVTLSDLKIDYRSTLSFSFISPENTANPGGITLFGKSFGDYGQDIKVNAFYKEDDEK